VTPAEALALVGLGALVGLLAASGFAAILRRRPRGRHRGRRRNTLREDLDDDVTDEWR